MKQILIWLLCLALTLAPVSLEAMGATDWPTAVRLLADGGIVMDADTGAVLYGENIHHTYFPASITKLMTALLVIENCKMDETVTFSDRAVYDVEEGSKSLCMLPGDTLTVKDCLYGLLLHSSNETANALAEHVAGSIEGFADMMNRRAAELGCENTHFSNPSGLNNPEHYTTAYDMALIGQAVMQNEELMVIDSSLSYRIPPSKALKEGQIVYPGHKMLKKSQTEYYPGVIGGKTGFTSLAGNTLVTFAEKNGIRLIVVILNGHLTHYTDTKALLDFGFRNFYTVKATECDQTYATVENDLSIAGLSEDSLPLLTLDPSSLITLPKAADTDDLIAELIYQVPPDASTDVIATVNYSYGGRHVGSAYLQSNFILQETEAAIDFRMIETGSAEKKAMGKCILAFLIEIGLPAVSFIGTYTAVRAIRESKSGFGSIIPSRSGRKCSRRRQGKRWFHR